MSNLEKQPLSELIFNPILYTEYPYHYITKDKIIFSKAPILVPSLVDEAKYRQLEIENNLMKQILTKPISYTYGVR